MKSTRTVVPAWAWIGILVLLDIAPLHSKVAGACWLALCILGAWLFRPGPARGDATTLQAARIWLWFCILALILRAVPQIYWGDSWQERHAEFRLLLGALGLLGMVWHVRLTRAQVQWSAYALVLANGLGLGLMVFWGATFTPTNRIAWGASMALLVCVLLPLALDASRQGINKTLCALGVIAGLGAVLLSQARGSYGIVLWLGGVLIWHIAKQRLAWRKLLFALLVGAAALVLLTQAAPNMTRIPVERVSRAITELQQSGSSIENNANDSVGARLLMWQRALATIPEHPLLGVGREARIAAIHRWGLEAQASSFATLGNVHNEYLQALFDQGLFGLCSFLALIVGLIRITLHLQKSKPGAALGMAGIVFMHATSSLTNVNFGHNYYATMLSVAIVLTLLLASREPSRDDDTAAAHS